MLAEVDAAGLDIGRSGVEGAILRDLPIADTLFDTIPMNSRCNSVARARRSATSTSRRSTAAAQTALFGSAKTGTLAANATRPAADATVADLAQGAPADLTFGTLLFSLLDTASYPWEQIAPAAIDPTAAVQRSRPATAATGRSAADAVRSSPFTFDPGPGESHRVRRTDGIDRACPPGRCRRATTSPAPRARR